MKKDLAYHVLQEWDRKGRCVFARQDLVSLFAQDSAKAFAQGLGRLVGDGVLVRACRGVYVNPRARSLDRFVLERVVTVLRRGEYSYLSLESMLSEYGVISQIPVDRLTVMTTGRKGEFRTPYGVIELTHTSRSVSDILTNTRRVPERPLRLATPEAALRDLKRVGRNVGMVEVAAWPTLKADLSSVASAKGES